MIGAVGSGSPAMCAPVALRSSAIFTETGTRFTRVCAARFAPALRGAAFFFVDFFFRGFACRSIGVDINLKPTRIQRESLPALTHEVLITRQFAATSTASGELLRDLRSGLSSHRDLSGHDVAGLFFRIRLCIDHGCL
jgi:hypothetical protein